MMVGHRWTHPEWISLHVQETSGDSRVDRAGAAPSCGPLSLRRGGDTTASASDGPEGVRRRTLPRRDAARRRTGRAQRDDGQAAPDGVPGQSARGAPLPLCALDVYRRDACHGASARAGSARSHALDERPLPQPSPDALRAFGCDLAAVCKELARRAPEERWLPDETPRAHPLPCPAIPASTAPRVLRPIRPPRAAGKPRFPRDPC